MSDLFGNHIVGFPTRRLILEALVNVKGAYLEYSNIYLSNFVTAHSNAQS